MIQIGAKIRTELVHHTLPAGTSISTYICCVAHTETVNMTYWSNCPLREISEWSSFSHVSEKIWNQAITRAYLSEEWLLWIVQYHYQLHAILMGKTHLNWYVYLTSSSSLTPLDRLKPSLANLLPAIEMMKSVKFPIESWTFIIQNLSLRWHHSVWNVEVF